MMTMLILTEPTFAALSGVRLAKKLNFVNIVRIMDILAKKANSAGPQSLDGAIEAVSSFSNQSSC